MYLKEKLIGGLKVRNVILIMAGVLFLLVSLYGLVTLLVHYFGDWDTILHARRTPECICDFFLGILMIAWSRGSRTLINDASFFSRYFEVDLSGRIEFEELAEITGRKLPQVRRRLKLLRRLYMKKFQISHPENAGWEIVELYSKTVTCTCRSCGGALEKRVYFAGECPYCGSSDLTARVVSGERFYSICEDRERKTGDPSCYEGRRLALRRILLWIGLCLAGLTVLICVLIFFSDLSHYHDQAYLTKVLLSEDNHYSAYSQIKAHLRDQLIFSAFLFAAVFPAIPILLARLNGVTRAIRFAGFFSRVTTPFVPVSELPRRKNGDPSRELKHLVLALREGYLRGCAPEKHDGPLRIGLTKRIVRDRCPSCAAPITGAVDENYTCRYCGNLIMGVIRKQ